MKRRLVSRRSFIRDQNVCEISSKEIRESIDDLRQQLDQIKNGCHPEVIKYSRKVETWLSDQKQKIQVLHENRIDTTHNEYKKDIEICEKDCEIEKKKLQEFLVNFLDELKRRLESDKKNIELTPYGDVLDIKPNVTRKLRRRGQHNCPETTNNSSSFQTYWGDILSNSLWSSSSYIKQNSLSGYIQDSGVSPTPDLDMNISSDYKIESCFNQANLFGSLGLNLNDGFLTSHIAVSFLNQNKESLLSTVILNDLALKSNLQSSDSTLNQTDISYSSGSLAQNTVNTLGTDLNILCSSTAAGLLMGISGNNVSSYIPGNVTGLPTNTTSTTKRKKGVNNVSFAHLNLLLNENDIYTDLNNIQRACTKLSNYNSPNNSIGKKNSEYDGEDLSRRRNIENTSTPSRLGDNQINCFIDDGRLYYKQKWFHVGTNVILEGREGNNYGCTGYISLINANDISIKRNSDNGTTKISLNQLKSSRFRLFPSAT